MNPIFADWAPKYAGRGIHVLPCMRGGKRPLTDNGSKGASIDPAVIADWSQRFPSANIGLAMGPSGLVVLDIDLKHEGVAEKWDQLLQEIPSLANTLWARTGTGGLHVYMRARPSIQLGNGTGDLPFGFDIRGNGGYTIAPPSVNADGNEYTWENFNELQEIPLELIAHLQVEKWTPIKVSSELITEGGRHQYLFKLACSLRGKGFAESAIYGAIWATNLEQCSPPLDDKEVTDIAASAARYAPGEAVDEVRRIIARKGRKTFKLTRYSEVQPVEMEWLMPGYIAKGKFNLMWGLEGRGKSYMAVGLTAAITRGIPLPGTDMPMGVAPQNVLLLTYEDDPNDTIAPRLIKCGADMDRVYTVHYKDGLVNAKEIAGFLETIEEIPDLAMIVVDPLTQFVAGIDDRQESEVREAMNPLIQLAFKKKCAILGLKHANKDESRSWENRVAGSRAWTALARSVFLVGHDNERVQEKHHTYGGMVSTKGNFGTALPQGFEVIDGVFRFTGPDPTITPERLFPLKKSSDI